MLLVLFNNFMFMRRGILLSNKHICCVLIKKCLIRRYVYIGLEKILTTARGDLEHGLV